MNYPEWWPENPYLPLDYNVYDEIDEKLEALPQGATMSFSCPTPYCSGTGGKCAECETIWSECDCHYNELDCKCGERADLY